MGVIMELEFDKYCKVGRSPKTVLPSPRHQAKGHRSRKGKPSSKKDDYDLISLEEEGFTEIKFRNHRSVSCKNLPSGDVELERNEVLRRCSVYQSSTDKKFRRPETRGGRKKIEFSLGDETSFSFSFLDSICGSDEETESEPLEQKRSSVKLSSLDLKDRQIGFGKSAERDLMMGNRELKCDQVIGPLNNANILKKRDYLALNKSLSERDSLKASPKSRVTSIKKMLDPLTKSKSQGSPLNNIGKSSSLQKSLLRDSSSAVVPPCLPAHLNGNLKMERKQGVPYFEFSMAHSEDVFVAKSWKSEDANNWVYTFHFIQGRKNNNLTRWGIKYSNKDSPMVGQMQVSCYLRSELKGGRDFYNSMVTEFVLYDTSHARKSVTSEEEIRVLGASNQELVKNNVELDDLFGVSKISNADFSTPYPWARDDLHPSLEIAAVVIQVPFEKRESLKYQRGEKLSDEVHPLDLCSVHDDNGTVKVNMVTPLGNHGLPCSGESTGPSPLLDRWRLGGGCDCGGWDMACPLLVFGNPRTQEHALLEMDQPLKLYVQGGKENMSALTITITEKGRFTVNFHAQLSTLQAFAACVAILHTSQASTSVELLKNKQLLQCNSLKVIVEDQVKVLIEGVNDEEKQGKVAKLGEENTPSYLLNPPFSPIDRV